jgi:hypothetical protein
MATMDIFNSNAFSSRAMLQAFETFPHLPQVVRTLGLFTPEPIRESYAQIEKRDGVLSIIPTSKRGAPADQRASEKRDIIPMDTYRITKDDTIQASELLNIRAFGTESEVMQVQAEIARRLLGPTGIVRDIEYTFENMMLSAAQGVLVDADDSILSNFYDKFGVAQAAEIDFDLDNASPASGALRKKFKQVERQTMRAAGGSFLSSSYVIGLAGEAFWDDLNAHPEVVARTDAMLRAGMPQGIENAFGDNDFVRFGKVIIFPYWGSDDGAVSVPTDKCKFVPYNVPGLFRHVMAPGESFAHLGRTGQEIYVEVLPDRERERHVKIVASSYPLFVCTRPAMLQRAKRT